MKKVKVTIELPRQKKFLIIGSGDPIKTFLKEIKKVYPESDVLVLSDKQCDDAWSLHEKSGIDNVAKKLRYKIEYINNINEEFVFTTIKHFKCNICFVLGSRWILKNKIIDYFQGCIFNYHTSSLPKYRGGGGYRWQIMNEEKYIYFAFHQLVEKIDAGPILKEYCKKLIGDIRYPKDIFNCLYKFTQEKFGDFLRYLKNEQHHLDIQNEENSTYFPLLDNNKNGAINLSWRMNEIACFIRAFSYPYKGAFILYNDKKYFLKEVDTNELPEKYHPYAIGLIINSTVNFVEFIVKDGTIKASIINNENEEAVCPSFFTSGNRFYMTDEVLLEATLYRPSNKKFLLTINS